MTNKRFRLDTGCIIDQEENKVLSDVQVRNLLNNLAEENEQLKKVFNEMIRQTEIEINPDKPTLYSGTFIFTAEEFYFIRKIMEMD